MRKIYILFAICFITVFASGQVGQWTWLNGSSNSGSSGNPGVKGVPSASVEPPALYEACEWTDMNGKFWLYGGQDASDQFHDNLYKYDPLTNEWEWVSGTNSTGTLGNYGVQGVASASNQPPSRGWAPASWTDQNNNLWFFGGYNGGECNDLWKYDISTGLWTWMKGPNTTNDPGTYGTKGVPNIANNPASRHEGCASWADNSGNLWLFAGYIISPSGSYNDLWRFNIASNTWTWMKGSNAQGQVGTYGSLGVEAAANTPGNRLAYCRWKDSNGNFWFFGGWEWGAGLYRNDLWRYNPVTNNWAWMNGDSTGNNPGVYGTKCVAASTNKPGERYEDRAAWNDGNDNLWMLGGTYTGFGNVMNDLWVYCIAKNQWTWEGGDATVAPAGNWGSLGISSPANEPNGRAGADAWTDKNGHLYLFGGTSNPGITPFNDVWKFTIDPNCINCSSVAPPVAAFQTNDSILCTNDCINFTNLSTNANSYLWTFAGGTPATDTTANPQNICYLTAGTYNVTLVATNSGGSTTITATNLIKVADSPPTPVITVSNDTLYCSFDPSYTSYQWYNDTGMISGATKPFLVITQSGNYNVQVANANNCKIAVGINVTVGLQTFSDKSPVILIPNPAGEWLTVYGLQFKSEETVGIYNMLGERIMEQQQKLSEHPAINVKNLPAGIYFIQISDESARWLGKFVKE